METVTFNELKRIGRRYGGDKRDKFESLSSYQRQRELVSRSQLRVTVSFTKQTSQLMQNNFHSNNVKSNLKFT